MKETKKGRTGKRKNDGKIKKTKEETHEKTGKKRKVVLLNNIALWVTYGA